MEELVALANFRTRLEAETVAGFLDDAGIAYLIQSAEGMLIVPPPGGATIMVKPDDLERARECLPDAEEPGPKLVG